MLNTQIFIYPDEQRVQHFGWLTDGDMKKARSIIVWVTLARWSQLHQCDQVM